VEARRHLLFVEHVAGKDHVDIRRRAGKQVAADEADGHAVEVCVEGDGGFAHRIDVVGGRLFGAGQHGCNGDQPRAGRDIQHAPARNRFGMCPQVSRHALPAGPGKRPEGRGDIVRLKIVLRRLPDRREFVGLIEPDRLEPRHGQGSRIRADKGLGVSGGQRPHFRSTTLIVSVELSLA
jgi:hypothetical protein